MAQAAGAATGETIHTTANHPWLTTDRGWVLAGDLHAGELVRTLDGQIATVAWVHTVPGQADYYNLTVADDHTYAVGDGQYVVHNDDICANLPDRPSGRGPTEGYLDTGNGNPIHLDSAKYQGMDDVNALPDDTPALGSRWSLGNRNHVEAKAAAIMRLQGLNEATLHINNEPCSGALITCSNLLSHMLPEDATLNIHVKGTPLDQLIPFTGAPDSECGAWWSANHPPPWRSP